MNELLQIQKAYDCRDVWYARMHASIIVPNNRYTHFESQHTTNGLYKRHKQQRRFVRNQKRACVSSDTLKGALWIHCRTQSSNSTPSRVQLNEYAISRDRDRFAFTCSLHSPAHKKTQCGSVTRLFYWELTTTKIRIIKTIESIDSVICFEVKIGFNSFMQNALKK